MQKRQSINLKAMRLIITAVIAILILTLLLWNYFHGGVPSHHILDRKDLPEISNWWNGLWLPVLTWILLGRINSRIEKQTSADNSSNKGLGNVLGRFMIGLIFGIILAVSFVHNFNPFLDNVLYILLILTFIVPLFFSEFILGFVLGMTYTFGAILPTVFIFIIAVAGFLIYRFIRPLIFKVPQVFISKQAKSTNG